MKTRDDEGGHLVHFDGEWPPRERALVEMAVLKAERALGLPIPEKLFGRPWICTMRRTGDQAEYYARRVNLGVTIETQSAGALIDHLRNRIGRSATDG